jgi:hypothetical protein
MVRNFDGKLLSSFPVLLLALAHCVTKHDIPIHDVCDVATVGEKLHNLVPLTSQLRPMGRSFRVLFEAANRFTVNVEIDLAKVSLRRMANGERSLLERHFLAPLN